jgi:polyhydroxyalkanoate synthesis regulator protein
MQTINPILIKKYTNRKLYHTSESHYISNNDILDMVKQDIPFTVLMHNTNENVTKEVLLSSLSNMNNVSEQEIINFIKAR